MSIQALPSYSSLGLTKTHGSTTRGFTDAAGQNLSRRAADDLRAQSLGFNSVADYQKAAQADRVASGVASSSPDYTIQGKNIKAVSARESVNFRTSSSERQVTNGLGQTATERNQSVIYNGKANPATSLTYSSKMDRQIEKFGNNLDLAGQTVARVTISMEDGAGLDYYASSPLMRVSDLENTIAKFGGLAEYADYLASHGGDSSSVSGGGAVVAVTVTSY